MSYFDELKIDVVQEKPQIGAEYSEAGRRLMYMLKAALNGKAMALTDKSEPAGERVVAVSPEWIDLLGWTIEDLNDDPNQIWHPDDVEMIAEIGANDLAGPYAARMNKKSGGTDWYKIEGLTMIINNRHFRCFIIEETEA